MSRDMRSVSATMRSSRPGVFGLGAGTLARDLRGRPHHRDGRPQLVRRVRGELRRPPKRVLEARERLVERSRQAIELVVYAAHRKTLRQVVAPMDLAALVIASTGSSARRLIQYPPAAARSSATGLPTAINHASSFSVS